MPRRSCCGFLGEAERDVARAPPLTAVTATGIELVAGLRISEALDLRWRDVNLATRKLQVVSAKTAAGVRAVDLSPTLQEVLSEFKTRTRHAEPDNLVFCTAVGKRDNPSNVRNRFLADAVKIANGKLEDEPIAHLTPHSLRRTFASLLLASGANPRYVMGQMGHKRAQMTLEIYGQLIDDRVDHGAAIDGLVGASEWALMGTNDALTEVDV